MKTILAAVILFICYSCTSQRDIQQAEIVNAQLIKIDTVYRYSSSMQRQLTWRDEYDMEYVTYASLNSSYKLGSKMAVLVKR